MVAGETASIHGNNYIVLFDHGCRGLLGSRRHSSVAGISRAEQLGRRDRCHSTHQDQSHQLGAVENSSALVAVFTVRLGRSTLPDDLCRQRTSNALLSVPEWPTGL